METEKIKCTVCLEEKLPELFSKCKAKRNGLRSQCKQCDANDILKNKERHTKSINANYQKNKERVLAYKKEYRKKYPEKRKDIVFRSFQKHKEKYRQKHLLRLQTDPVYALSYRLSKSIGSFLHKTPYSKKSRLYKILGCEWSFFISYIEAQFTEGMTWDNIHVDHIKARSKAKTIEDVINIFHYSNCQPLFALDNVYKSDKDVEQQLRLL